MQRKVLIIFVFFVFRKPGTSSDNSFQALKTVVSLKKPHLGFKQAEPKV